MSGTEIERQNTKAQYVTALQKEEVAWEAKQREARAAGMSRVGASNANIDMIASTAPASSASNGAGWAAGDLGPVGPPVSGAVLDLPPPAYSEYQPQGGSQAT